MAKNSIIESGLDAYFNQGGNNGKAKEGTATEENQTAPEEKAQRGRPRAGLQEGKLIKATFNVNENLLYKIKIVAANEGVSQKELLEEIFTLIVTKYEEKHGVIERKKRDVVSDLLK